jgi:enoyl-CoA hydratase/carnithine racemase
VGYADYEALGVTVEGAIATVTMRFQGGDESTRRLQAIQHRELVQIWRELEHDADVRVALITGVGDAEFYLSGRPPGSWPGLESDDLAQMWEFSRMLEDEVGPLVQELVRFAKPLVAAINGAASGAGLTVALLSDISIMAEDAWLFDPHIMLGSTAGDGAGALWPLFAGIPKAKLYLLTSDALDGIEADRIGLIGRAVPRAELMNVAYDYARRLAKAPPVALRFTKRGINQWLKLAELVSQDYSLALEALADYSRAREGNPHTEWPPRIVPERHH